MKNLKEAIQMFDTICHAMMELNHVFSIPSLVYLVLKFVGSIGNTFAFIFGTLNSNSALNQSGFVGLVLGMFDWTRIIIILSTADMPIHEVIFD